MRAALLALLMLFGSALGRAWAGSIDTAFLERRWPHQHEREFEVHKYPVRWRQLLTKREGIFTGAAFFSPSPVQRTWDLATDFTDLGRMTPGVSAVRFLEQTPTRQVVEADVKVLWKDLTLRFEIEQDPPRAIRFRLVNDFIGEYRGVGLFRASGEGTAVEVSTWVQPAVKISPGLIVFAERVVMMKGIRNFLKTCELPPASLPPS